MIRRIDRIATELPPPSEPDPAGATAVQELMGGRFGEMSTFLNYTFQSFNFRNRQGARPFYDLIANIAAEEFGHIEAVAAAINTMLTGAPRRLPPTGEARKLLWRLSRASATPTTFAGGQGALPQNSQGRPWTGDYIFSSRPRRGLDAQLLPETGARNNKLKVWEMVEHPAARALTGTCSYVEAFTGRLRTSDRASDRRGLDEDVPDAPYSDGEDPRLQALHRARRAPSPLPVLTDGLSGAQQGLQRPASGDR